MLQPTVLCHYSKIAVSLSCSHDGQANGTMLLGGGGGVERIPNELRLKRVQSCVRLLHEIVR